MDAAVNFIKKNTVLVAAWVLAVVSMFFVHPSAEYIDYMDFRTLLILWSLMLIMKGFMDEGVFEILAHKMIGITGNVRQMGAALVGLCFFSSMLITNDVALITFVPFTLYIFRGSRMDSQLIFILIMETIAANLGSMMTPIGNPQNLYLFNLSGMSLGQFVMLMLPYSVASSIMLAVLVLIMRGGSKTLQLPEEEKVASPDLGATIIYSVLFVVAVLVVFRLVNVIALAGACLAAFFVINKKLIAGVDYSLLMTFVGFFIFVGNMSNMDIVRTAMMGAVSGHEMVAGIAASQVISNVPAALLLSNFTGSYAVLIKAVNLGGLGTLIASMASLITFKMYANEAGAERGAYTLKFTAFNVLMLAVLVGADMII